MWSLLNAHVLFEIGNGKVHYLNFKVLTRTYMPYISYGRPHLQQLCSERVPDDISSGHLIERTEDGKHRKCEKLQFIDGMERL